jgi:RHS repeat-associated protein
MDAAGQTTQVTSPNAAESWSYTYDALGRLVSATSPSPGLDQSFQYDAAGNMVYNSRVGALTYPLPGAPRPHAPSAVNGDPMAYDANGNLLAGRGRAITWNARNLPVQVNATQYVYDGSGARLKKITPAATSLYPVGDDYEVTNGTVTKYANLPGLGLVAKRTGSATYWLHADRLGTIQEITDATGAVVQQRTYRPYGERIADSTSHEEQRGYIGERQDEDTGLSYLHARYYDSALGLFLSPDPLSPIEPGVGFNRYAYTGGNPIDASDPSGLAMIMACGHPAFADGSDCGGGGNSALNELLSLEARARFMSVITFEVDVDGDGRLDFIMTKKGNIDGSVTTTMQVLGPQLAANGMSDAPMGDAYPTIQEFLDGAGDLWGQYENMLQANTLHSDHYFHCLGNCEANRRGPGGRAASQFISYWREVYGVMKGDPWDEINADFAANSWGRNAPPDQSCPVTCSGFLPPSLPPDFPRP